MKFFMSGFELRVKGQGPGMSNSPYIDPSWEGPPGFTECLLGAWGLYSGAGQCFPDL